MLYRDERIIPGLVNLGMAPGCEMDEDLASTSRRIQHH